MSDGGPLVGVVVPAHDREQMLGEALTSVFAQTHGPLEVVVVDDGSTDGTAAVARTFPITRCLTQVNRGAAAARNAGVEAASASLIAFLDSDDRWHADKLALQVAYMEQNPSIAFCLTRMRNVLEPGTPRPGWISEADIDRDLIGAVPSTLMVRRSAFQAVGGFDPRLRTGEDVDWFCRATEAGFPFAILPQVLVERRIHPDSLCARSHGAPSSLPAVLKASLDRRRRRLPR